MIISIYISNINYGVILLNNLQTEQMKQYLSEFMLQTLEMARLKQFLLK